MKAHSFSRIILVLFCICLMPTRASAQSFNLNLPTEADWLPMIPPDHTVRMIKRTPDHSRYIVISIYPVDGDLPESALGGDRKQTHRAALAQIAAGGPSTYSSRATEIVNDRKWLRVMNLFITNNTVYRIDMIQDPSNPMKDSDIADSVRSFNYFPSGSMVAVWPFGPPQLPGKQAKKPTGLTDKQMVNLIANITFILTVLIVIGWVLLRVVREVVKGVTMPTALKRTTPPPLPPRAFRQPDRSAAERFKSN